MLIREDAGKITTTQTNLAKAMGLSVQRIQQLVKEGVVVRDAKDKRGGVFIVESIRNYYDTFKKQSDSEENVDYSREKALHEKAERQIAELKLKRMEQNVYDAVIVKWVMENMKEEASKRFLELPKHIAPMLAKKKRYEIFDIMTKEIEKTLLELSEYEPTIEKEEAAEESESPV